MSIFSALGLGHLIDPEAWIAGANNPILDAYLGTCLSTSSSALVSDFYISSFCCYLLLLPRRRRFFPFKWSFVHTKISGKCADYMNKTFDFSTVSNF
jgi:hypothetical protein